MKNKEVEYVVVGAGIIGLAIARELALSGREVFVLEKNHSVGEESSFRNSAVLHAGIYYPVNSLKAELCREGQNLLYHYCKTNKIPFKKIGKLIVMTHKSQKEKLIKLEKIAKGNGVNTLMLLNKSELKILEPHVLALQGLYSPTTGIVNGRFLLQSFQRDIEKAGGKICCATTLDKGVIQKNNIILNINNGEETMMRCSKLINAAGLWATDVARSIQGIPSDSIPPHYFAKGNYFKLLGASPFSRLVYPLPEEAGLGIHSTLDLEGNVRFGPDVEWIDKIDYTVSLGREQHFYREIRKYYPSLGEKTLVPEFAGVRPKIYGAGQKPQDFLIQSYKQHGIKNLINLYGMESPGLTASMAIGAYVHQLLN